MITRTSGKLTQSVQPPQRFNVYALRSIPHTHTHTHTHIHAVNRYASHNTGVGALLMDPRLRCAPMGSGGQRQTLLWILIEWCHEQHN